MTVEELRVKTIDLMSDPNMPVSLEYATELIGDLIAAAKEEQLKEDLATVKKIPQYMVDVMGGWTEGSGKSAQLTLISNLAKASARYVEELIPDLFPKENL